MPKRRRGHGWTPRKRGRRGPPPPPHSPPPPSQPPSPPPPYSPPHRHPVPPPPARRIVHHQGQIIGRGRGGGASYRGVRRRAVPGTTRVEVGLTEPFPWLRRDAPHPALEDANHPDYNEPDATIYSPLDTEDADVLIDIETEELAEATVNVNANPMSEPTLNWMFEYSGGPANPLEAPPKNPSWVEKLEEINNLRREAWNKTLSIPSMINNCPVGFQFSASEGFQGKTLGEIVEYYRGWSRIQDDNTQLSYLNGMFIRGNITRYRITQSRVSESGGAAPPLPQGPRARSFTTTHTVDFPLSKIVSLVTNSIEVSADNINFEKRMNDVFREMLMGEEGGGESPGSSVELYVVMGDCYFYRRFWGIPEAGVNEILQYGPNIVRTAGFGELLCETVIRKIVLSDGSEHSLIIPGGYGNCVELCMEESLSLMFGSAVGRKKARSVRAELKRIYIERCMTRRVRSGKTAHCEETYARDFERNRKHGYTTMMMLDLKRMYLASGMRIRICYPVEEWERNRAVGRDRIKHLAREVGAASMRQMEKEVRDPHEEEREDWHQRFLDFFILRINYDGKVYEKRAPVVTSVEEVLNFERHGPSVGIQIEEDEEYVLGEVLHAVTLTPTIDVEKFLHNKRFREEVVEKVEVVCKEVMRGVREKAVGIGEKIGDFTDMKRQCDYQLQRHRDEVTCNLFFKTICGDDVYHNKGESLAEKPKKSTNYVIGLPLIIAYDLETVQLKKEAFDWGRVDRSLFRNIDLAGNMLSYTPVEKEIPYSIQWVPVNLSDEGIHLSKKEAIKKGSGLKYSWLGRTDPAFLASSLKDKWFRVGEKKRVKGEWIVLDEPKIEYGRRGLLGECVHDFIDSVGKYALSHSITSVYCYAHNGCGFDAFVIESFNTKFNISKRLKTGRGILCMTLDYPYLDYSSTAAGKEKILKIHFRDTKVFLSFSLAQICKDFSVPKEWQKLDFPITRVKWYNYHLSSVKALMEAYALNDVLSLAFVIKQINRMITFPSSEVVVRGMEEMLGGGANVLSAAAAAAASRGNSPLSALIRHAYPANLKSVKPPIVQFVTFMSVVKKSLDNFFSNLGLVKPMSVDVTSLRHWIDRAQMGGRSSAYAKFYASGVWGDFVRAYRIGDLESVKQLANQAITTGDSMIVLDVTSLYPHAMSSCPMPTGSLSAIVSADQCKRLVDAVHCETCDNDMQLCIFHRGGLNSKKRDFAIILVRNLEPSEAAKTRLRHLCARKKVKDGASLQYSVETSEELEQRLNDTIGEVQAYTNVDLYWMLRQGFVVGEYLGGMVWESTYDYRDLILGGFEMRKVAKTQKNQCLQLTLKLFLNGMYGIHSQKAIRNMDLITTLPEGLFEQHHSNPKIGQFIAKNHNRKMNANFKIVDVEHLPTGQSIVIGKVKKDLGENLGGYSPNHIGCAVLAWSRHIMNLLMFNTSEKACTYTDTDSVCVSERVYQEMKQRISSSTFPLVDEMGEVLGSYKNDHADHFAKGDEPRVIFSAIGTKKVKMHVVVGRSGAVKIANTYKGFLSMGVCPESGKKFSEEKILYEQSKAILEILYDGVPQDRFGTRWNRNTGQGVTIERQVLMSSDSKTYLNFCRGFTEGEKVDGGGFASYVVPFGSTYSNSEVIEPILIPARLKADVEYQLPEKWKSEILPRCLGGVTFSDMNDFLNVYYRHRWEFYRPQLSPAEEEEYNNIHKTFDEVDRKEGEKMMVSMSVEEIL